MRAGGPPLQLQGPILVNEMTMTDPEFYINDAEDGVMFEDNCAAGIWLEMIEANARPDL
jgi:hypothetical protein